MVWTHKPWINIPDDQRCEGLARPVMPPCTYQTFLNHERRCSKKATQSRDGRAVCHVHAEVCDVKYIALPSPPVSDEAVA
jgi:hypothetical protein